MEKLACQTAVCKDLTVTLPGTQAMEILTRGPAISEAGGNGYALAFDIGTTTLAGFLLKDGREVAQDSRPNPHAAFGADVVSRIQQALKGHMDRLADAIRGAVTEMTVALCGQAGISPERIEKVCVVGNPAMQQLFLDQA